MTQSSLTHCFVVSYLLAFVLSWFAPGRPRIRAGAIVALVAGVALSLLGAVQDWSGHDWIDDGHTAERILGVVAAAGAFVLLVGTGARRTGNDQFGRYRYHRKEDNNGDFTR
ncbi:hypothetical protein [Burkholderia cenocepacia]|uniref:hypothetical protein n=1 Tax=Burkholderia cenocepacia TaxID=95486 RepID=UPI002AB644AF|nr:hypothetical protein [Burkholderia cenocepacia]